VLKEFKVKHPYYEEPVYIVVIWAKSIPDDVAPYKLYQQAEFSETIGVKRRGHRGAGTGDQMWHYINEEVNPGFPPYPVVSMLVGSKTPGIFPFSKVPSWALSEEKRGGIRNLVAIATYYVTGSLDYPPPPNLLNGFSFEYSEKGFIAAVAFEK